MTSSRRISECGFSMVEVLISITIGLLILIAIAAVYQTAGSLQQQQQSYDEIHAPIKAITGLLKTNITQAGYVDFLDAPYGNFNASGAFDARDTAAVNAFVHDPTLGSVKSPMERLVGGLFPIFGCDGQMNDNTYTLAVSAPPISSTCGSSDPLKNSLQVAYQTVPGDVGTSTGSAYASVGTANSVTGEGRDCLQQQLPSGAAASSATAMGLVINRFYVATKDGINELHCMGSGNRSPQPIAQGVEEFVVRYQVSSASSISDGLAGGKKSQFLTATQVTADTVGWPGVTAVEICIVVANVQTGATGTAQLQPKRPTCSRKTSGSSAGSFADDVTRASGDSRLWKRFTFTFALRNAIYAHAS